MRRPGLPWGLVALLALAPSLPGSSAAELPQGTVRPRARQQARRQRTAGAGQVAGGEQPAALQGEKQQGQEGGVAAEGASAEEEGEWTAAQEKQQREWTAATMLPHLQRPDETLTATPSEKRRRYGAGGQQGGEVSLDRAFFKQQPRSRQEGARESAGAELAREMAARRGWVRKAERRRGDLLVPLDEEAGGSRANFYGRRGGGAGRGEQDPPGEPLWDAGEHGADPDPRTPPKPKPKSKPTTYPEKVIIAMATEHFFGAGYERVVPGCREFFSNATLHCEYVRGNASLYKSADAIWYHLPHTTKEGRFANWFKETPDQVTVGVSMESDVNYPQQQDTQLLWQLDVLATYSLRSAVPLVYYLPAYKAAWLRQPALPVAEKLNAIAYINSNCAAPSGRDEIVGELMHLGMSLPDLSLPVHSYGRCRNNMAHTAGRDFDKGQVLRKYKFCIAMENSLSRDYFTEKAYDGLVAGCLPITNAPNAKAVLDYNDFGTPVKLMAELMLLALDDRAYAARMAWRALPESAYSASFRRVEKLAAGPHPQCRICQKVLEVRMPRRHRHNGPDGLPLID